jgi:hypothetical protein
VAVTLFFGGETVKPGHKGQTRGPALAREEDVREETKEAARYFLLTCGDLNGDRGRGSTSKTYLERVRTHDVLVDSYVSSYAYDVSNTNNPTVTEGESMRSVKNNSRTLVEQWCHSSSS